MIAKIMVKSKHKQVHKPYTQETRLSARPHGAEALRAERRRSFSLFR